MYIFEYVILLLLCTPPFRVWLCGWVISALDQYNKAGRSEQRSICAIVFTSLVALLLLVRGRVCDWLNEEDDKQAVVTEEASSGSEPEPEAAGGADVTAHGGSVNVHTAVEQRHAEERESGRGHEEAKAEDGDEGRNDALGHEEEDTNGLEGPDEAGTAEEAKGKGREADAFDTGNTSTASSDVSESHHHQDRLLEVGDHETDGQSAEAQDARLQADSVHNHDISAAEVVDDGDRRDEGADNKTNKACVSCAKKLLLVTLLVAGLASASLSLLCSSTRVEQWVPCGESAKGGGDRLSGFSLGVRVCRVREEACPQWSLTHMPYTSKATALLSTTFEYVKAAVNSQSSSSSPPLPPSLPSALPSSSSSSRTTATTTRTTTSSSSLPPQSYTEDHASTAGDKDELLSGGHTHGLCDDRVDLGTDVVGGVKVPNATGVAATMDAGPSSTSSPQQGAMAVSHAKSESDLSATQQAGGSDDDEGTGGGTDTGDEAHLTLPEDTQGSSTTVEEVDSVAEAMSEHQMEQEVAQDEETDDVTHTHEEERVQGDAKEITNNVVDAEELLSAPEGGVYGERITGDDDDGVGNERSVTADLSVGHKLLTTLREDAEEQDVVTHTHADTKVDDRSEEKETEEGEEADKPNSIMAEALAQAAVTRAQILKANGGESKPTPRVFQHLHTRPLQQRNGKTLAQKALSQPLMDDQQHLMRVHPLGVLHAMVQLLRRPWEGLTALSLLGKAGRRLRDGWRSVSKAVKFCVGGRRGRR